MVDLQKKAKRSTQPSEGLQHPSTRALQNPPFAPSAVTVWAACPIAGDWVQPCAQKQHHTQRWRWSDRVSALPSASRSMSLVSRAGTGCLLFWPEAGRKYSGLQTPARCGHEDLAANPMQSTRNERGDVPPTRPLSRISVRRNTHPSPRSQVLQGPLQGPSRQLGPVAVAAGPLVSASTWVRRCRCRGQRNCP